MKNITIEEIIKKLDFNISCKEYTYNLDSDVTKCDKAIEKYILKINKKALSEKNIDSIKEDLKKAIFDEDETSNINSLMYFNIKDENIYIYSLAGFSNNITSTFKKDNSYSFLRFLMDEFFKDDEDNLDDKYLNVDDYLTIKTRDYIKKIFSSVCDEKTEDKSDCLKNSLFEEINYISTLPYEGIDVCAKVAIMNKNLADKYVNYYIKLDEPIKFDEYRKVRKLLQTSDKNTYLIGDNENIYGLGKFTELSKLQAQLEKNTPIFIFDFTGRFEYKINCIFITNNIINKNDNNDNRELTECTVNENFLVNIKNGKPNLIENRYSESTLESALKEVFNTDFKESGSEEKINLLKKIVGYAKNQKHGTTLVITTPKLAKSETEQLVNQSIKIKEKSLINEDCLENLIYKITNIDGAIYIDINSCLYAIGVILDGTVDEKHGDSSRGSRYNSAIKYSLKKNLTDNCIIVVISEDGMVDIIYKGDKYDNIIKQVNELFNDATKSYNKKDYEATLNILDEILKLDATSADSYYKKGVVLSDLGKNEEAIKCYDLAIKCNPDCTPAYNNKGIALSHLGQNNEAIKCYDLAIKCNPEYALAYNNKGVALSHLGQKEEAQECYRIANELKQKLKENNTTNNEDENNNK
jgi:tetratricopeptide (TPR) repeat protein